MTCCSEVLYHVSELERVPRAVAPWCMIACTGMANSQIVPDKRWPSVSIKCLVPLAEYEATRAPSRKSSSDASW